MRWVNGEPRLEEHDAAIVALNILLGAADGRLSTLSNRESDASMAMLCDHSPCNDPADHDLIIAQLRLIREELLATREAIAADPSAGWVFAPVAPVPALAEPAAHVEAQPVPESTAPHRLGGRPPVGVLSIGAAAVEVLREAGRPLHASEVWPLMQAKGARSSVQPPQLWKQIAYQLRLRQRHVRIVGPRTWVWVGDAPIAEAAIPEPPVVEEPPAQCRCGAVLRTDERIVCWSCQQLELAEEQAAPEPGDEPDVPEIEEVAASPPVELAPPRKPGPRPRGSIGIVDAAVAVLREAGRPLSVEEVWPLAEAKGARSSAASPAALIQQHLGLRADVRRVSSRGRVWEWVGPEQAPKRYGPAPRKSTRPPCPGNNGGGHHLVQPSGQGVYAPFTCARCDYSFTPEPPPIKGLAWRQEGEQRLATAGST